jgi:hypothetical protein
MLASPWPTSPRPASPMRAGHLLVTEGGRASARPVAAELPGERVDHLAACRLRDAAIVPCRSLAIGTYPARAACTRPPTQAGLCAGRMQKLWRPYGDRSARWRATGHFRRGPAPGSATSAATCSTPSRTAPPSGGRTAGFRLMWAVPPLLPRRIRLERRRRRACLRPLITHSPSPLPLWAYLVCPRAGVLGPLRRPGEPRPSPRPIVDQGQRPPDPGADPGPPRTARARVHRTD